MTSANRIVLSAVWTFVAAFTAPITSAQEADPFRIRISRTPSESFQTDDVAGELRTARLQPSEPEALPGARDAPGESVVDSINEGQQPTTLEDEAARRRRRRRERHSSLIFGSEYGSPVYQDSLLGSRGSARLMRTPAMFGDIGGAHISLMIGATKFDVPLASASRLMKISENNQAIPMDRAYVSYHYFRNAFRAQENGAPIDSDSVNRFLFGFEKTLCCSGWSVELRMPFTQGVDLQAGGFRTTGGEVGDLLVSLKRLIYQGDSLAVASGLGLTVPVGSGVHVFNNNIRLEIENDALHIHPYIALTSISRDGWFYHGFLQLDVPMNGNDVFATVGGNTQQLVFDEIPLVHVDVSAGFWLFRSPGCLCGTCQTGYGVAAVAELHYTSSFQDQSTLMFNQLGELRADQFSVLNVTFGLHTELGSGTVLRLGSVFPLGTGTTRLFDAEFQATLTQRF